MCGEAKKFNYLLCRGNATYGINSFTDNGDGAFNLEQNYGNTILGSINISAKTIDWCTFRTVSHVVNIAQAGPQAFGIGITQGGFNLDWIKFTPGGLRSASVARNNTELGTEMNSIPNPVNDNFNIELGNIKEAGTIEIFDKQLLLLETSSNANQMNISELKSGIYLIRYNNTAKRFIKQ